MKALERFDLGGQKIVHVANGTAADDAAAFGQIPSATVASVAGRTGAVVLAEADVAGLAGDLVGSRLYLAANYR